MRIVRVLCHEDGALLCKHDGDRYRITLTDRPEDPPIEAGQRWLPVTILTGLAIQATGVYYNAEDGDRQEDDGHFVATEDWDWDSVMERP